MTFEQQLSELETLVDKMEKGEISLEDSLSSFEQGIKLARSCQKSLKDAELKVKILLNDNDENTNGQNSTLSDFEE
jgi:exodeoxyribonuclease VII small subunit